MKNNIAVIVAVATEAPELVRLPNVHVSGLGKINAAAKTAEVILTDRPVMIVNFGSAGGITVGHGLHRVARLLQRDINCLDLGYPVGATPFETLADLIDLECEGVTCGTGDNFVAGQPAELACDIVDMEAYAVARVCQRFGIPFACWKWVSDRADAAAGDEWLKKHHCGRDHFFDIYQNL